MFGALRKAGLRPKVIMLIKHTPTCLCRLCVTILLPVCGYRNPEEFWSAHIGSEVAVRSENSPPPAEEDQFTCLRLLVEAAVAVSQRDHVAA